MMSIYDRPQMLTSYSVHELMSGGAGFTSITCFEMGPSNPQCDIITE